MGRVNTGILSSNDPRDSEIHHVDPWFQHQLRRCGPLKTFQNVRNESGFKPRFPGHLGNRMRCLTLGISQALHCHDTPWAPRTWWVLCRHTTGEFEWIPDGELMAQGSNSPIVLKDPWVPEISKRVEGLFSWTWLTWVGSRFWGFLGWVDHPSYFVLFSVEKLARIHQYWTFPYLQKYCIV